MALDFILNVAKTAGISEKYLDQYGRYKAKVDSSIYEEIASHSDGKLVLVTAITPTKAGEGKTTTSIALCEGLAKINQKAMLCLREPSLGPVFGIKGGATGGGKASIGPSEDINLHFTGDMHALTTSINLISAVIDNSIYQGNPLNIDPNHITWKRALDMNDRALREVTVGMGKNNGVERKDGFVITVASELMAILCLAQDADDFQKRVNSIIVAYDKDGKPITVKDLQISHAIMKLMREALKPNLVQTLENNPVLVHGGPFANIAHGCNSLIATKMALKLAPVVVTEAGFGADLGAEKFMDIACRAGNLHPDAVVMVATIRALKMHGGHPLETILEEDVPALLQGVLNLKTHLENMKKFKVPVVVAINHFEKDHESEVKALTKWCEEEGYPVSFLDGFLFGGEGSVDLANKVMNILHNQKSLYQPLYDVNDTLQNKIITVCKEIYRAGEVIFTDKAKSQLEQYTNMGYGKLPVCMAKTPQSLTDNPLILNAPKGFSITIREVNLSAGAGFVVALTGEILTMPGLPKIPAAVKMEELPY